MSWFKRNNEIDNRPNQYVYPRTKFKLLKPDAPNQPTYPETIVKRPPENNHRKEKIYIVMAETWDDDYHEAFEYVNKVFKHKDDAIKYMHNYKGIDDLCDDNPIEMEVY